MRRKKASIALSSNRCFTETLCIMLCESQKVKEYKYNPTTRWKLRKAYSALHAQVQVGWLWPPNNHRESWPLVSATHEITQPWAQHRALGKLSNRRCSSFTAWESATTGYLGSSATLFVLLFIIFLSILNFEYFKILLTNTSSHKL